MIVQWFSASSLFSFILAEEFRILRFVYVSTTPINGFAPGHRFVVHSSTFLIFKQLLTSMFSAIQFLVMLGFDVV